jgi:hypothetical protein
MSKKTRKPRQLPNDGLDKGTPEYQAKVTLVKVETDQKSFAYRVKDQRPIDKYHRWYVEDEAKGISDSGCRGLNHDQFRTADRMFSIYARTVLLPAQGSLLQVRVDTSATPAAFQIERCMQPADVVGLKLFCAQRARGAYGSRTPGYGAYLV